jgi:hypothetical protein
MSNNHGQQLAGKIAVITGGNSGIGLATAKRFVEEGAHVVITGRREKELKEAAAVIGKNVTTVVGDVTSLEDLDRLYAVVKEKHGHIDVLFANAGWGGTLPFHATTRFKPQPPAPGEARQPLAGQFSSPDALFLPRWMAATADDPSIKIEPAWKVSKVYGMPCAIYNLLPTTYYLAARFRQDFEGAILNAVNAGGHNQARAMLTGSLVGAQVGLSGIPARFLEGLNDREALVSLTVRLVQAKG